MTRTARQTGGCAVQRAGEHLPQRGLALEVRRFVTEHHRRRRVPVVVHLGVPGGARCDLVPEPGWDAAMRADALGRLLDARPDGPAWLWLSRGGDPGEASDDDLAWLRAARSAGPSYGVIVDHFVVVTRAGWRDLVTGRARTWVRARPLPASRPHASAAGGG